jgi:hypothetical protein
MHETKREPVASRPISSYQTGVGMLMAKELFEEGLISPQEESSYAIAARLGQLHRLGSGQPLKTRYGTLVASRL